MRHFETQDNKVSPITGAREVHTLSKPGVLLLHFIKHVITINHIAYISRDDVLLYSLCFPKVSMFKWTTALYCAWDFCQLS